MNRIRMSLGLLVAAVPLVVAAQTANTPGGSASTGTPIDQTKSAPGSTAAGSTQTTPDATNPSGSGAKKRKLHAPKLQSHASAKNSTKPGDAPTYPAPTASGQPTK